MSKDSYSTGNSARTATVEVVTCEQMHFRAKDSSCKGKCLADEAPHIASPSLDTIRRVLLLARV